MTSPSRRRVVEAPARKPPAELQGIRVIIEEDPDPDLSWLNPDGLAAFEQDEFKLLCVRAEADVLIEEIEQTLTSSGIGGVMSDDTDDLEQVQAHEWMLLRGVLKTVGIPTEQLPLEVDPEWIEWRT